MKVHPQLMHPFFSEWFRPLGQVHLAELQTQGGDSRGCTHMLPSGSGKNRVSRGAALPPQVPGAQEEQRGLLLEGCLVTSLLTLTPPLPHGCFLRAVQEERKLLP